MPTYFQEQQYLKSQWSARWWLSVVSFNEAPSNTASNITAFTFFISLLHQWSAHHEKQSVEQPPCCCGLSLGPSGQWAALPTQPASPGRWHGRSTNVVWRYDSAETERKQPRQNSKVWLYRLRDVYLLAPSTPDFHLMVGQSPLQFFLPSSSFHALSLVSPAASLSARPGSEASLLSTPMPLRQKRLWWGSSHWSCVLPFCERRQGKSACRWLVLHINQ